MSWLHGQPTIQSIKQALPVPVDYSPFSEIVGR